MGFELSRDADGKPYHVCSDDGFAIISRPFNPEEDGWMEDQLDPGDFLAITIGRQTEALVHEVNALRRENFSLRKRVRLWTWAAGYEIDKAKEQT